MRPAGKFRLWSPGFKNRPDISPPGLLILVFIASVISVVATIWFSISYSLTVGGTPSISAEGTILIGFLHLVLPLTIAIAINSNHPSSRLLIFGYSVVFLSVAAYGSQMPRPIVLETTAEVAIGIFAVAVVNLWLFFGRKNRYYYALIQGKPIPTDLAAERENLAGNAWLSPRLRSWLNWTADHLETVVIIILLIAIIAAVNLTGRIG